MISLWSSNQCYDANVIIVTIAPVVNEFELDPKS